MFALFQPLLKAAPKDGISVTKNVSVTVRIANRCWMSTGRTRTANAPMVIFFHGGAYVRGDKDEPGATEIYGNVLIWFARHGIVGINANYRLAPTATWPAAAQDVGRVVTWAKMHGAQHGGDPSRIYLIGHSAGATHVATYTFDKSMHAVAGPGIVGAVLISGRYRIEANPADPNLQSMRAYFGSDTATYPARSPITHIRESAVPVFIVIAQYDHAFTDLFGAELFSAICERDRACPRFTRLTTHNHISEVASFNTADEQLGREILAFILERQ